MHPIFNLLLKYYVAMYVCKKEREREEDRRRKKEREIISKIFEPVTV